MVNRDKIEEFIVKKIKIKKGIKLVDDASSVNDLPIFIYNEYIKNKKVHHIVEKLTKHQRETQDAAILMQLSDGQLKCTQCYLKSVWRIINTHPSLSLSLSFFFLFFSLTQLVILTWIIIIYRKFVESKSARVHTRRHLIYFH